MQNNKIYNASNSTSNPVGGLKDFIEKEKNYY